MRKAKKKDSFGYISQIIRAHRKSCVLFSGFELGILERITKQYKSAQKISDELHISIEGLNRLLSVLCAFEIVKKKQEMYCLSDNYKDMFDSDSEKYIGDLIRHEIHLQKRWLQLSRSVKSGLPIKKTDEIQTAEDTSRFINAMANIGQRTAPMILDKIKFKGDEHILDLGGGPGRYIRELCKKYPRIQVTLFEKPETVKAAKKILKKLSFNKRMHFIQGDFFTDNLGKGYDVILFSNVVHIYGFDEIRLILNKCYQALNLSGRILIKDYFLNEDKTGPEFATIFSMHMFLSTDHGRCYSEAEFYELLKQTGFKKGKKTTLTESSLILEGIKKAEH